MNKSKMQLTSETITEFWNDSCSLKELKDAVAHGAAGATSNPVIVYSVINQEEEVWLETLKKIITDNPTDTEDEITWKLIEHVGIEAAKLLKPAFDKSGGKTGRLSLQVNPKYYMKTSAMVEHAVHLAALAPNIAIKAPCTKEGIAAMEEMTARGIVVNGTVCFTVPQALACAEAIETGLKKAKANGIDTSVMKPWVTIMVGRLDDQLKRDMNSAGISIDPGYLEWAGIAAFKKAYQIFKKKNYSATLLAAAYRNYMQWSELVGGDVVLTIPYKWWQKFNKSDIEVIDRIDTPVDQRIIDTLYSKFPNFKKAYNKNGMPSEEFVHYPASIHTLNQFLTGYSDLLAYIRSKMLI